MEAYRINNDPKMIAGYFLGAVKSKGGCWEETILTNIVAALVSYMEQAQVTNELNGGVVF